jgi:hypothetical protein
MDKRAPGCDDIIKRIMDTLLSLCRNNDLTLVVTAIDSCYFLAGVLLMIILSCFKYIIDYLCIILLRLR